MYNVRYTLGLLKKTLFWVLIKYSFGKFFQKCNPFSYCHLVKRVIEKTPSNTPYINYDPKSQTQLAKFQNTSIFSTW